MSCILDLRLTYWTGAALFAFGLLTTSAPGQTAAPPAPGIPIKAVTRDKPIDFQSEILPFLKDNCLACHNQTRAKASLILETPQTILKGGDTGPGVTPGSPGESLLLQAAAHQSDDLIMPPKDNKVAAVNLTSEQLGLLKLWIEQGAKGEVHSQGPVSWQAVPASLQPIYAVAVTPDGRFAACSRANRIFVYHLPSARLLATLADPALMTSGRYSQPTAHTDLVYALAFSHDASTLASGGYREIKLWRQPAATTQFRFANNRPFRALAASPDGKWIALAGDQPAIVLWNAAEGREIRLLAGHEQSVTALSFSPDSAKLLSTSHDKTLRVWSVPQGTQLALTNVASPLLSAAWLGAARIAVGAEDHLIRLWTLPEAADQPIALLRELKGHQGPVTTLAVQKEQLLSGSQDGTLRWWNAESGESTNSVEHGGPVSALAIRPDGLRFASGGDNQVVRLWNAEDNKMVSEWKGDWRAQVARAKQEQGVQLAGGEIDYRNGVLKTDTNELTKAEERRKKATETHDKTQTEFAGKEKALAEARQKKTDADQTLASLQQQLDQANKAVEETALAATTAKKEAEQAQAQSPADENLIKDRKTAAETKSKTADEAKQKATQLAEEFKTKEGKLKDEAKAAEKNIGNLEKEFEKTKLTRDNAATELDLAGKAIEALNTSIKQDQDAIAQAETGKKEAEKVLEAARQREASTAQPIRCLSFSSDNQLLAAAGDQQVLHTYSAQTGDPYDSLDWKEGGLSALAFLGGGRLAAASTNGAAAVIDLNRPWTLDHTLGTGDASSPIIDRVNTLTFSPNDQWLASGGGEPSRGGEILLWQMPTGHLAQAWKEIHSDSVSDLEFSPDGQYLGSAAADRFLRITDVATGKSVKAFEGHTHHVLGLSWKADGRTLASAGADNMIKVWNFNTGERKKNIEGFAKEVTSVHFVTTTDQLVATSGDSKVRLVKESGDNVRQFEGSSDFVYASAVSADGKIVVAGGQDGVLRVWDLANGKQLAELKPPSAP